MNTQASNTNVDPEKDPRLAPSANESFTATIENNSSEELTLTSSSSDLQWTEPPPNSIASGGKGKFRSPGSFTDPAAGNVTYTNSSGASIVISWDIPSLSPNNIRWCAKGNLSISQSGSTSGWTVKNTFKVTDG